MDSHRVSLYKTYTGIYKSLNCGTTFTPFTPPFFRPQPTQQITKNNEQITNNTNKLLFLIQTPHNNNNNILALFHTQSNIVNNKIWFYSLFTN